ncbi:MAG TPA: hypothetical protein VHR18_05905 [Solirubrobacterales bacterium]|jgi:spheroidene monooxygenase|nr:hypothetical protein [Solirubrobacterales bacterium]
MVGSLDLARLPLGPAQREVLRASRRGFAAGSLFARQLLAIRLQSVPFPLPQMTTVIYLALWEDEASIARFRESSLRPWLASGQHLSLTLAPLQSFGSWRGEDPLGGYRSESDPTRPTLLLTHSATRARSAPAFLIADRPVVRSLPKAPGHLWAGGFLDRVRSLDTGTLSLWSSTEDALGFAYSDGEHQRAVKAQREGRWFGESWFARFNVTDADGRWGDLDVQSLKPS